MVKFKVGDTVRCVRNHHVGYHLVRGQEYKVAETRGSGGCIRVNNGSYFVFCEDRFELVVPPVPKPVKFKVGDTVRCVNSDGEEFAIAQGANYLILNERDGDVELVGLNTFWFSSNRFELVTPKPKPEPTPSTYTVTWVAPRKNGYTSLIDGELSFGTEWEAYGFAGLFRSDVRTTVTKD
jgi:plastocyanin